MSTQIRYQKDHPRTMHERVILREVVEEEQFRTMHEWLKDPDNGAGGYHSALRTFDTYELRMRPWGNHTAFFFSDPRAAMAFKLRWG